MTSLPANLLDRWVVSRLNQVIGAVTKCMDAYDIVTAARAIEDFTVNDFSLWYVRRSRRRLQQPKTLPSCVQHKNICVCYAYAGTFAGAVRAIFKRRNLSATWRQ